MINFDDYTNDLINSQSNIDKIHLHVKDLYEVKY